MSHSIFWDYFTVFVDRCLDLDISWCDDCAFNLFDFIKWEGEGEASLDVVFDEFQEEVMLLQSAFMIAESKYIVYVMESVFVVDWLKGATSIHVIGWISSFAM